MDMVVGLFAHSGTGPRHWAVRGVREEAVVRWDRAVAGVDAEHVEGDAATAVGEGEGFAERVHDAIHPRGGRLHPLAAKEGAHALAHVPAQREVEHAVVRLQRLRDRQCDRFQHLLVSALQKQEVTAQSLHHDHGERPRFFHHAQQEVSFIRLQEVWGGGGGAEEGIPISDTCPIQQTIHRPVARKQRHGPTNVGTYPHETERRLSLRVHS